MAETTITAVSPVLRLALGASKALEWPILDILDWFKPYEYVGHDALARLREDADIPSWLVNAMRERP